VRRLRVRQASNGFGLLGELVRHPTAGGAGTQWHRPRHYHQSEPFFHPSGQRAVQLAGHGLEPARRHHMVYWDGQIPLQTSDVNASQVQAVVTSDLVAFPGTATVVVMTLVGNPLYTPAATFRSRDPSSRRCSRLDRRGPCGVYADRQ